MVGLYQFLKNKGVMISFALGAVLSLLAILIVVNGFPADPTKQALYDSSIFNFGLNVTLFLIIVGLVVSVVFPVVYMAQNIKESYQFLITIAVIAVIYFVSKSMGTTPTAQELVTFQGNHNKHLIPADVAFVDGLLIFAGFMVFGSLIAWVFSIVWDFVKQR